MFPRQALQARRLGLVHPTTGEQCEWTVPLAGDFAELIARAGIEEPELGEFGTATEDAADDDNGVVTYRA